MTEDEQKRIGTAEIMKEKMTRNNIVHMTLEELRRIPLTHSFCSATGNEGIRQYTNETFGICKEIVIRRDKKTGVWGNVKVTYRLSELPNEFNSVDELLHAINSKIIEDKHAQHIL